MCHNRVVLVQLFRIEGADLGQRYEHADAEMQQIKVKLSQFTALRHLADARINLAEQRKKYVATRKAQISFDVLVVVNTIDVRAFAASQSGVPDADQVAKAVQAASGAIPAPKSAPTQKMETKFERYRRERAAPAPKCAGLAARNSIRRIRT